jgi:poly(3-hydroxybutyrate) depolymerase
MQKFTFTLSLLIGMICSAFAQNHVTCDGSRYANPTFATVDSTLDILYGNNTTFAGNNQDLYMDIYEPVGDPAAMRPVIILAFGGSFISGQRQDMEDLCRYYAHHGFVAVTVDYRLYDGPLFPFPSAADMTDVVIKSVGDMKAAIRFLREDAATTNNYKIDPNVIFVGGISAGGIAAAHTAYVDSTDVIGPPEMTAINNNGGFEGNSSNNVGLYSSEVHGVVNFSGALRSATYIRTNSVPLFSAHDDMDGTVPYNGGNAQVFGIPIIYMEGSGTMNQQATNEGVTNFLITIPSSTGHVSYFGSNSAQWQDSVLDTSTDFLHDNVICPLISSVGALSTELVTAKFYPNPANVDMMVSFENLPSNYTISLYDNVGRKVFEEQGVNTDRYVLAKERYAAGVYFVNIQFEDANTAPIQSKVIFQ